MTETTPDEQPIEYWPSVADLFLGVLLVVVLWMVMAAAAHHVRELDLSRVWRRQDSLVQALRATLNGGFSSCPPDGVVLGIDIANVDCDLDSAIVRIRSDAQIQHITFSTEVLFRKDSYQLNADGRHLLDRVGRILAARTDDLLEIQVTGHADPDRTRLFASNLHLAGLRAMQVFAYMQSCCGLDPNRVLMSAISFGEYVPVARLRGGEWSKESLDAVNRTPEQKARNRRIELRLLYRRN